MDKRFVYADNAATTQVSEEVLNAMLPYFREGYGNASSIYAMGREAKKAVELAREKVAQAIGADASEIYFTSCGSEADNWAVKGICERLAKKAKSISSPRFSSTTLSFILVRIWRKRALRLLIFPSTRTVL